MKITFTILTIICLSALAIFFYFKYFNLKNNDNKNILKSEITNTNNSLIGQTSDKTSGQTSVKDSSKKVKIVAIGDSLTAGYNVNLSDSYPKILEKSLIDNGYNIEIVNAGISGETTSGLLNRIDFIISQNPDIVLITIGGNDFFRNIDQEDIYNNIDEIVKKLKQNISVDNIYLFQIQIPNNFGQGYSKDFREMYIKIAKENKIKSLPFVTQEVFLNSDFMLSDGIHPNNLGYKFIVENYIYKDILQLLKK